MISVTKVASGELITASPEAYAFFPFVFSVFTVQKTVSPCTI
jgi:hypothetical protein